MDPGGSAVPTLEAHPPLTHVPHEDRSPSQWTLGQEPPRTKSHLGPGVPPCSTPEPRPGRGSNGNAPEPGADFILGCQRNQKWRETKGKELHGPRPHIPTEGPKAKCSHKTKAKVQRKKESRSLTGWSVFGASAGRRDGGASKQMGPGRSLFVVGTVCTSSRRSITSQAGRSPLSVLPSLCPSVCPCRARENLLG